MKKMLSAALAFACLGLTAIPANAQTFRERLAAARAASVLPGKAPVVPAGTRVLRDVGYGDDPRQAFDVYLPATAGNAAVIFLVHGGGWAHGNKDNPGLVEDKAAYWLPKGYVLISANYRLVPEVAPLDQARDLAQAVATAQELAKGWGADRNRFVLMGHSAGAHLVALLGASPRLLPAAGATPPLGVISLDSGAMDVPQLMELPRLPPLYHRAFGKDRDYWISVSPYHALTRRSLPMLAVCSSRRSDACPQTHALARKAATLGVRVEVLSEDLSHRDINRSLGQASAYTEAVDAFLQTLLR